MNQHRIQKLLDEHLKVSEYEQNKAMSGMTGKKHSKKTKKKMSEWQKYVKIKLFCP